MGAGSRRPPRPDDRPATPSRPLTFAETIRARATQRGLSLPHPAHPEPLAQLAYPEELQLKNEALRAFWTAHGLPACPEAVVAAVQPRGYRTTTKRRAVRSRGALAFTFAAQGDVRPGLAASVLDPPEHLAVYEFLLAQLGRSTSDPLAAQLSYAIVRGTKSALAVILNLSAFGPPIVRRAKQVAEALATASLGVRAAFLYLDPTGSDYYLEARRPRGTLSFKKLFGPERLEVEVAGARLGFPPVVFSQINGSMLPALTHAARALLQPVEGRRLLDLYCGYGLFSLTVGREAAEVVGIDAEGPAIEAARENARRSGQGGRARFVAGRITADFLASGLRRADARAEIILLDPPRQGTAPGVIAALAARGPERIVHVFCGTDEIPREIEGWRRSGYAAARTVALDLFPGTANLETMVQLIPVGLPPGGRGSARR